MFEEKSAQEVAAHFRTDIKRGLSTLEAEKRLRANGPNELEQGHKKSAPEAFFEQLNDPLICVLLVAAFVSFLLREISDALIIVVVVLVNATVGVIQEGKAQKALDSLKKMTSPHALVRRSGKVCKVAADTLVTGDVVILETGAQVPADVRLIRGWNLKVEESALTGEPYPSLKDANFQAEKKLQPAERKNEAFMSTMVTAGRGEGVVIATGMDTEIGKIASFIKATPRELTPLQKRLAELGKILSILSVGLCVLLFIIAVLQRRNIPEMLITAISLAVAAVPEGLPAIVTIVLAMSVSRMVKVHTIIRKLPSVETLGSVNVVCSDKTGTLTQNRMTVTQCYVNEKVVPISLDHIQEQAEIPLEFLRGFALCNDAALSSREEGAAAEIGDPTEIALLKMVAGCGVRKEREMIDFPRIDEKAFDSARKMMTTLHRCGVAANADAGEEGAARQDMREERGGAANAPGGFDVAYTKGAPDVVLKRCTKIYLNGSVQPMTDAKRARINAALGEMSSQALRVLALAMKQGANLMNEKDMVFVGLAAMKDPVRPEAAEAVLKFRKAGVRTVMITGDHADTALAIARELGIAREPSQCMTGEEMDRLGEERLQSRLPEISVFARVSPEHKVQIVRMLKSTGNIVAMTGDGVNDAPSLSMADIGVAMGMCGTDVAAQAADMVLTDDNFATIEKAIEEGRGIYENIKKTVLFLLSSNFGEIITMFVAVLAGLASPLKASHILWINLITDSLPALALGVDKNDNDALMDCPPRPAGEGMFDDGGWECTLFYGFLISAISLTAFLKLPWEIMMEGQMQLSLENIRGIFGAPQVLARSQTYAFTVLGMSQLFHALGMQDVRSSVFSKRREFNSLMAVAFVAGFSLQLAVTEVPVLVQWFGTAMLSLEEWLVLMVLAAFPVLAHEILVVSHRILGKQNVGVSNH